MRKLIILFLALLILFPLGLGVLTQNQHNQQQQQLISSFQQYLTASRYSAQGIGTKQAPQRIVVLSIDNEITHSTELMVQDAMFQAFSIQANLIVVFINTPGGELSAVEDIMNMFEVSSIPVCVFVAPLGSTAWSGGTYLLMSSHIAVMSSGTLIVLPNQYRRVSRSMI